MNWLFHRQKALEEDDLRKYAAELDLDVKLFDKDRIGAGVLDRVRRDVESGISSGEVPGNADAVHQRRGAPRGLRRRELAERIGGSSVSRHLRDSRRRYPLG